MLAVTHPLLSSLKHGLYKKMKYCLSYVVLGQMWYYRTKFPFPNSKKVGFMIFQPKTVSFCIFDIEAVMKSIVELTIGERSCWFIVSSSSFEALGEIQLGHQENSQILQYTLLQCFKDSLTCSRPTLEQFTHF
jgi:hypothetical protein